MIGARLVLDATNAQLFDESQSESTDPLPDVVPPHHSGICSSGSTGSPKVILRKAPAVFAEDDPSTLAVMESWGPLPSPQLVLTPGPIYHNNGFLSASVLLAGHSIVLMERFQAERMVDLIERYRVYGIYRGHDDVPATSPRSRAYPIETSLSIQWVMQGASVLPHWLARCRSRSAHRSRAFLHLLRIERGRRSRGLSRR